MKIKADYANAPQWKELIRKCSGLEDADREGHPPGGTEVFGRDCP